jgi:uncharacterized protein
MEDLAATTLRTFSVLAKPIGPICNLSCEYCYYLEKVTLYPGKSQTSEWILPVDTLEEYIRQYIQSQPASTVNFAWQGGEPTLLGVDYFSKVVDLQLKHANGKQIKNSLQTNGVLLDDRWCEFLAANHFLIGLSIDGPRSLHDRGRLDKGGAPSFDKVMRGVAYLKKHGVEFNTLTVLHRHNSRHPLEVYLFLKEIGSRFLQFIPVIERVAVDPGSHGLALISPDSRVPARISDWSVEPLQYGKFLSAIFDKWVRNDVGKIFVQLFDVALEAWVGMESGLCIFQSSCGSAAVIEHNGDIYSCDHYVYPENRLGNIMDRPLVSMLNSPQQIRFGRDKLERMPRYCRECKFRLICNGGCPKHRFMKTPDGEENLNYLCPGYKLFFAHIDPYMAFMAGELGAERPPANIMSWLRDREGNGAANPRAGRNDPCPCGSGRKYKRCCGRG